MYSPSFPGTFWLNFFSGFWLIGLKSQWAYLIINHKLCTREIYPTPTHPHPPLPLPTPTHPYPYLPPPTPTTPYHHPPLLYPLPPPTPTAPLPPPTPTTTYYHPPLPPPLPPPTPTTPTTTHPTTPYHHPLLLQIMVLKEVKWLVMYKCGAGAGDGSKHPPTPTTPSP